MGLSDGRFLRGSALPKSDYAATVVGYLGFLILIFWQGIFIGRRDAVTHVGRIPVGRRNPCPPITSRARHRP